MDNFKQKLIEEFGQGIVDHVSRNRGKYAVGAGAAGLVGYGAYNGNLGSATNYVIDNGAAALGMATSELPYNEVPYQEVFKGTPAIYNAEEDPNVPLMPGVAYDIGQAAGNIHNGINRGVDNIRGMFESEVLTAEDDDEDGMGIGAGVGTFVAGSGAVLAGVANADKIKKVIDKASDKVKHTSLDIKDSVAIAVKDKASSGVKSLSDVLLKTSQKINDSKNQNISAKNTRNDIKTEAPKKPIETKSTKENSEKIKARLQEKLRKRNNR